MSVYTVSFRTPSRVQPGRFVLFLPDLSNPYASGDSPYYKRPTKTLILLHGFSGNEEEWLYNSPVLEWSLVYNLAIVMPDGGLNFYLDLPESGRQYCTFIGDDLINYLRNTFHLACTKEDTIIGGISMGGFGALHTAFTYPENFSKVIALSSALIIHQLKDMKEGDPNLLANYAYYVDTFRDLEHAETSDANPEVLYKRLKENNKEIPEIFIACGTEDFLYKENVAMKEFLEQEHADLEYREGPGIHNWSFWVPYGKQGIEWALQEAEENE